MPTYVLSDMAGSDALVLGEHGLHVLSVSHVCSSVSLARLLKFVMLLTSVRTSVWCAFGIIIERATVKILCNQDCCAGSMYTADQRIASSLSELRYQVWFSQLCPPMYPRIYTHSVKIYTAGHIVTVLCPSWFGA